MINNHLKFAFRLLRKDGFYSLLNILGLSIGISCGILVLIYLQNDLTYDQHHVNHKKIYRMTQHMEATGASMNVAQIWEQLPELMMNDMPEIETYVRFNRYRPLIVKHKKEDGTEVKFTEERLFKTDSNVFNVFTHQFIHGNPETSLQGLNKLVLTASTAKKYFGAIDALGKSMQLEGEEYIVTGIVEDVPDNTHLKFDILISGMEKNGNVGASDDVGFSEAFWNPNVFGYLVFNDNYNTKLFYDKFPVVFDKYYKAFGEVINGKCTPYLERLDEIHFYSDKERDLAHGNINYVYAFAAIGLFIIILACINYMNLATARSVERTGEMGIRKVLGYSRSKLFMSILVEAMLSAVIAMILSIAFSYFILNVTAFNDLIGKELTLDFVDNPELLFGIVGLTAIIGLLSGIYPAFYIPSVPIVKALKGAFKSQKSGIVLRKGLITFQFLISILVIICTTLMGDQISYMRQKDLGFNKDNILLLGISDTLMAKQIPAFKEQLIAHHNVSSATFAYGRPGMGVDQQVFMIENTEGEMTQQEFNVIYAGYDYLETMGIELLEGRDYEKGTQADFYYSYIVNETTVEQMGWDEQAMGKKMTFFHDQNFGQVTGVVKDFNFTSLHNKIEPLVIILDSDIGGWMHLKLGGDNLPATMAYIKEEWLKMYPNYEYEYEFLDSGFNEQYEADEKQYFLVSALSYLCIVISILGLVGLSAFTAGQKVKEIGVRKALGASNRHILVLFSKDYVRLIVIGFLIAVPIANYVVREWAGNFAYQASLNIWHFILPGVLVLIVALLAVSGQSMTAAKANPVEALKSE